MPPFAVDDEPAALLYLITLTAGLLDGDGQLIELIARAGTRAVVTGQAATRIHPAVGSFASQQWDVTVEEDALLVALPGPAIPYRGSRYFQRGRVELSPNARVIWGDIWLAGRYERGAASERFEFDRIVQDFEVRRSGRLLYRDRFRWDGPWSPSEVDWHFGGELATATLYASGPLPASLRQPAPGLRRAVFPIDAGGGCIRWCGPPAIVTEALVSTALHLAAEWTDGPGSPPWLLESSGLAPNHWFSTPPIPS
jgi:urease accessory protein